MREPTTRLVERAQRYCVPNAVAALTGDHPADVARFLLRRHPRSRGWFPMRSAMPYLRERGYRLRYAYPRRRMTLARWLREDGRDAIVSAGHHAHLVLGGKVAADNGITKRRGRVSGAIIILGRPTDASRREPQMELFA